ncbi:beta-lactamase family protein [Pseudomonas sp. S75]|uniref:serine hydrolase domain-containing protein n=1 Tax=unclassified Pseudomonas TaxID=196821 RepID=UPI001905E42E|nr:MULTISPECIES: serine hydrolase domain-containing protein [unclassified Pseudomonas]MBJ9975254.1 beta-lactamase family protein [Pseudomonas sp. S30]MBK0152772.1 beta-lactamase family protein [Pseudomonas sp. S75]
MIVKPTIDKFINDEMHRQEIPGLSLGILRNGEVIYHRGYGQANLEHGVPVYPYTLFQSGSVGKMFTAAAIMLLVEDKLITLDGALSDYFPMAPVTWRTITVRHLLNHTSGLGEDCIDVSRPFTDEDYVLQAYDQTPEFASGRRWRYSNLGYSLLGILVSRVSGVHLGDFLRSRVFEPCAMMTACMIDESRILRHRAAGYEHIEGVVCNQEPVSKEANRLGSGSLYLSLQDWAAWDSVVARRSLLSAASWQEMFKASLLGCGQRYPYGFGWDLATDIEGSPVHGHLGSWQGFVAGFRRYDQRGVTVVALANLGDAQIETIIDGVAERYSPSLRLAESLAPPGEEPLLTQHLRQFLMAVVSGKPNESMDCAVFDSVEGLDELTEQVQERELFHHVFSLHMTHYQPNGDRLSCTYDACVGDETCTIWVDFDAERKTVLGALLDV